MCQPAGARCFHRVALTLQSRAQRGTGGRADERAAPRPLVACLPQENFFDSKVALGLAWGKKP